MNIIYQDKSIIVVEKPPGIESEDLVRQFNLPLDRGGLVHRLDKDTSGLMVIAKEQNALENLQEQFKKHTIKKVYTTLVNDKMDTKRGSIEVAIARDPKRKQAMKVISFSAGLERGERRGAVTEWEVTKELKVNSQKLKVVLTLLSVTIRTGRTHQIRVHMQYIGHPVLGDKMYNTKESRRVSNLFGLKRQFLHASKLGFRHPKTGEWIEFRSELPKDLQLILNPLNHEA